VWIEVDTVIGLLLLFNHYSNRNKFSIQMNHDSRQPIARLS